VNVTVNAICVSVSVRHDFKAVIRDFNSCSAFLPFVRNEINARRLSRGLEARPARQRKGQRRRERMG